MLASSAQAQSIQRTRSRVRSEDAGQHSTSRPTDGNPPVVPTPNTRVSYDDDEIDFASIEKRIEEKLGVLNVPQSGTNTLNSLSVELSNVAPPNLRRIPPDQDNSRFHSGNSLSVPPCSPQESAESIHLHFMNISKRLRSTSLLSSTTAQPSASDITNLDQRLRSECGSLTVSKTSSAQRGSSIGFQSSTVPPSWGNVIPDGTSSSYSSRTPTPISGQVACPRVQPLELCIAPFHEENCELTITNTLVGHGTEVGCGQSGTTELDKRDHRLAASPLEETLVASLPDQDPSQSKETEGTAEISRILSKEEIPKDLIHSLTSNTDTMLEQPAKEHVHVLVGPKKTKKSIASLPRMSSKVFSSLNFRHSRGGSRSLSSSAIPNSVPDCDGASDEQQSHSRITTQNNIHAVQGDPSKAPDVWERALKTHQEEKAKLYLDVNKDQAKGKPRKRERSHSRSTHSGVTKQDSSDLSPSSMIQPAQDPLITPSINESWPLPSSIHSINNSDMGAWARYPSHTRSDRIGSAGPQDQVEAKDFADGQATKDSTSSDHLNKSTPQKKHRYRTPRIKIPHSKSMSFSLRFRSLRTYSDMFRSSSPEYRAHGHGHRTSTAVGGKLDYPELELLPPIYPLGQSISEESQPWSELFKEPSAETPNPHDASTGTSSAVAKVHNDHIPLSIGLKDDERERQERCSTSPRTSGTTPLLSALQLDGSMDATRIRNFSAPLRSQMDRSNLSWDPEKPHHSSYSSVRLRGVGFHLNASPCRSP
jgi:hypothetical protein